ncbi:RNA polymerase sigma-54 factor [Corticibacter populi]|uniref:RNA polymerase sigma-54 factor n=1 Tax=Corticibacter populi TaxID=1550736 RepID=A0A3M6QKN5_9BURK|nr:RNA polymerase factor sigma-54 [Corticibacter populi]RMX03059.1 RNA polymerase sigma-54 factor [Corticibacter populi]RZS33499.1 RNA polymerase RpoN-/SigL-like sigma 54 subunit [Corticibacter populi]
MKLGVSLRTSQNLALTPQLQQSIRLLQLSTLEMQQEVEQMLDENPFLEVQDEAAETEAFGVAQADAPVVPGEQLSERAGESERSGEAAEAETPTTDLPSDWEGDGSIDVAADDGEWGGDALARGSGSSGSGGSDEDVDAADIKGAHVSLTDFLHAQAGEFFLDAADRCALDYLIESLNEDGYLEDDLQDLALPLARSVEEVDELLHHFQLALNLLHNMEPAGVGARSLAECLQLQIRAIERSEDFEGDFRALEVARLVCAQPLELLARRDIRQLAQLTGASQDEVRTALLFTARLEPKPGRRFADVERNVIVPDVIVRPSGRGSAASREFTVRLNPEVMPRLKVHEVYANALRGNAGGGELQQRLQEARWFIKNIQQRFDTILRVSQAIVERQKNFFIHGEMAMRPMVLREIADELGLHESTISRVTTAKYMDTPHGTFELKYFFGSGLDTETGGSASSTAVRALIKQLIAAENPQKPLSDSKISDLLKEQGIECARRTVAKYREAMRIAPANLRKSL